MTNLFNLILEIDWLAGRVRKMPGIFEIQSEREKRGQRPIDVDKHRLTLQKHYWHWDAYAARLLYLQLVEIGIRPEDPANRHWSLNRAHT